MRQKEMESVAFGMKAPLGFSHSGGTSSTFLMQNQTSSWREGRKTLLTLEKKRKV
jgi:hypothetical protein